MQKSQASDTGGHHDWAKIEEQNFASCGTDLFAFEASLVELGNEDDGCFN